MAGKKGGKAGGPQPQTEFERNLTQLLQAGASGNPAARQLNGGNPDEPEEETLAELLDEARELAQDDSAIWVVATRRLEGVPLPDEETGLLTDPWLVIVLDARSGQMLHAEPQAEPSAEDVSEALLLYMLDPGVSAPKRPAQILTEDGPLALSLHMALAAIGVRVERQDLPGLQDVLGVMAAEVQDQLRRDQPLPFLGGLGTDEVEGLVAAFSRFLAAEPWTVFAPNRPVYASWTGPDGERAHLYATLMGELGQEFGLALYPDWLSYVRHVGNAHDVQDALEATGGLEALTLSIAEYLHPDDLSAMRRAGLRTGEEPGLLRVGQGGVAPPLTPVVPLTAVLNLLSARAERRANRVTSLKAAHGGVQLRYPAGPGEELETAETAGSVRVTLGFRPNAVHAEPAEVVFSGPAGMLVRKAFRGVQAWLDERDIRLMPPLKLSLPPDGSDPDVSEPSPDGFLRPRGPTIWQERTDTPDLTLAHLTRFARLTDPVQLLTLEARWQPGAMTELSVASDAGPRRVAPKTKPTPGRSTQGTWVKMRK